MSDSSSLSDAMPSSSVLEDALRDAVQKIYRSRNLEDLTVNRVRRAVEKQLVLEDDYFKNDSFWKEKSKHIILSEVVGALFHLAFKHFPLTLSLRKPTKTLPRHRIPHTKSPARKPHRGIPSLK